MVKRGLVEYPRIYVLPFQYSSSYLCQAQHPINHQIYQHFSIFIFCTKCKIALPETGLNIGTPSVLKVLGCFQTLHFQGQRHHYKNIHRPRQLFLDI